MSITFDELIQNGDGQYTLSDDNAIDMGLESVDGQDGYFVDPETGCYYVQNGKVLTFVAGNEQAFRDYLNH